MEHGSDATICKLSRAYELKQQREELRQTQEIMDLQKDEMRSQNKSIRRQAFETTFLRTLELHSDIVSRVSLGQNSNKREGREAFMYMAKQSADGDPRTGYAKMYKTNEAELGHYFRTLYNLIRYIDEHGHEQRAMYSRLVRAQLSRWEVELLFYNGLSKHGEKFKPLIEKYSLLKHLSEDSSLNNHRDEYDANAFERNAKRPETV